MKLTYLITFLCSIFSFSQNKKDEKGNPIGEWKYYYESGKLFQITDYQKNANVITTTYFENGKIMSSSRKKENDKVGDWLEFFSNGDTLKLEKYDSEGVLLRKKIFFNNGKVSEDVIYKPNKTITKEYFRNGNVLDEYTKVNRKTNGLQKEYFKNGNLSSINNFKNGKYHGEKKEYYINGTIKIEANYEEDKRIGVWKSYFQNGKLYEKIDYEKDNYEEFYVNGNIKVKVNTNNDEKIEFSPDGKIAVNGEYKKEIDTINGVKKFYNGVGSLIFLESYKDNKESLEYKSFYDNGQLKVSKNYKNGSIQGEFKEYYDNGVLDEIGKLKEGKPNTSNYELYNEDNKVGKWIDYSDNGAMSFVTEYENGEKVVEESYNRTGQISTRLAFNKADQTYEYSKYYYNGVLSSKKKFLKDKKTKTGKWFDYHKDGSVFKIENYLNGNLEGKSEEFLPNGKLLKVINYKNGKLNGEWVQYHKNKKIEVSSIYKDGELTGISKRFHFNGDLKEVRKYENGVLKEKKEYFRNKKLFKHKKLNEVTNLYEETEYDSDGNLYQEKVFKTPYIFAVKEYKNDKLYSTYTLEYGGYEGGCKTFYETGELKQVGQFRSNKMVGEWKTYRKNGAISAVVIINSERKIQKEYYENKQLKSITNYKAYYDLVGEYTKDGAYTGFHKNGVKKIIGNYTRGKKAGEWKTFNAKGVLINKVNH